MVARRVLVLVAAGLALVLLLSGCAAVSASEQPAVVDPGTPGQEQPATDAPLPPQPGGDRGSEATDAATAGGSPAASRDPVADVAHVRYRLTPINAPCCPTPTVDEAIEAAQALPGVLDAQPVEGGVQVTYQPAVVEPGEIASAINRVSFLVETVDPE